MNYPNGHEFEHRWLKPTQIKTDPLYQRPLEQRRVDQISKEWSGDLMNEPKVSYRDGTYWVFNGQHTTAAWRKIHNGKDEPIYCKVYKGMTWLEECDAFIKQNGISKDPTSNEKLRALYNSKEPDVVDMVQKAELCGFVVDFIQSKTPTRIVATSALFRAYKSLPPEAYLDMMTTIKEAWFGDSDAVSAQIITGMCGFYKAYWGHFKHEDLVKSLKRKAPSRIIRNGMQLKRRTNTYAREILDAYNTHRSKYRLSDEKL